MSKAGIAIDVERNVSIPVAMITKEAGDAIKGAFARSESVTATLPTTRTRGGPFGCSTCRLAPPPPRWRT